jgi:hemerythrin-like domain-containing protein
MKRHLSLHRLSHDHHHGLAQSKRFREAGGDRAGSLSAAEARDGILAMWDRELRRHFREEEDILFPVFARFAHPHCREILDTLAQHVEIRCMVETMREHHEQGRDASLEAVHAFGEALRAHIQWEESTVFPAIEVAVPEEAMQRLGERLQRTGDGE